MNQFIRSRARDDIIRQFRWYLVEKDAPDVAFKFVDAVESSIGQMLLTPEIGVPTYIKNPILHGLRAWPVKDFEDFRVFYVVAEQVLKVVRILHARRDLVRILNEELDDADSIQ